VTVLAVVLMLATFTDLRRREIPNWLTGGGAAAALALAVGNGSLVTALVCGVLAAAPFLAACLIRPEGMGMGDAKLAGVLGLFLGWAVWPALVAALAVAGLTGALLALGTRRTPSTVSLPLAPFLALGAGLTVLMGANPLQ
jgi:leader peptidase (prepilin peptidase)/N-methyltransferase